MREESLLCSSEMYVVGRQVSNHFFKTPSLLCSTLKMCIFLFWGEWLGDGSETTIMQRHVLTHPFPLQPLLLLLLEVFLPLQALLLCLLPGFSLSLFFLKHTHNFNAGSQGGKNLAKITCLFYVTRMGSLTAIIVYGQRNFLYLKARRLYFQHLQPREEGLKWNSIFEPFHNYTGACSTTNATSVNDHKGVAKPKCQNKSQE